MYQPLTDFLRQIRAYPSYFLYNIPSALDDDDQDVIFAQLDVITGMGTETFAIAFVPEESILLVGGVW